MKSRRLTLEFHGLCEHGLVRDTWRSASLCASPSGLFGVGLAVPARCRSNRVHELLPNETMIQSAEHLPSPLSNSAAATTLHTTTAPPFDITTAQSA